MSDDLPGMWETADLIGGATDATTWAEAAALHEEKKDLYGCHRNFISMRAALQDLNQRA